MTIDNDGKMDLQDSAGTTPEPLNLRKRGPTSEERTRFVLAQFERAVRATPDSPGIPEHMIDGFRVWLISGIRPGSFGESVLLNDLAHASGRADYVNRIRLADYGMFLICGMPQPSWGSEEKLAVWEAHRGLSGWGE